MKSDKLDIRPLSRLNDPSFHSTYPDPNRRKVAHPIMMETLETMRPKTFFEQFLKLTMTNPPAPQDAKFIKNVLEPLGLTPGEPKTWESNGDLNRRALIIGFERVLNGIKGRLLTPTNIVGFSNESDDTQ